MSNQLVSLDALPSAADFYERFWNRQPFVVRGAISRQVMDRLITADELAGLSMEEGPQARIIRTAAMKSDWTCRFGPFTEEDFDTAGDTDWSLLIQNVEQFHPDTSTLLGEFNFAPRWLMDDVMVSFSCPGGSVGPHIDSYHVFLVQGQGTRRWKIGHAAMTDEVLIQGLELKVLVDDFVGDEIEVASGDVLYIPPRFAHEGKTLDAALTFSVGFLGPKVSELFSGYSQYLSEHEELDQRYVGDGLTNDSAGFSITDAAVNTLRENLSGHLQSKNFSQWVTEFFTESSHEDFGTYAERDAPLNSDELAQALGQGASLFKPEYIKFAVTSPDDRKFCLGFDRHSFVLDESLFPLIQKLMTAQALNPSDNPELFEHPAALGLLLELYNHQALEFTP